MGLGRSCAWLLHVGAMALAPLSTVQVVLSTGVVMLAVFGQRMFGCRVSGRQWLGVLMTAAGLALLVVTLPGSDQAGFAVGGLIAFEAGMLALGSLLIVAPRLGAPGAAPRRGARRRRGHAVRRLRRRREGAHAGVGPARRRGVAVAAVAALASVLAFLASARAFQEGEAVPVIASTSTAANVTAIAGGIVVFGDALAGGLLLVVQLAAFALIVAAAMVTPSGHARVAS